MKDTTFQQQYREVYSRLGFKLSEQNQVSEKTLSAAEAKVGMSCPQSLRDYYLVAGNERRLNHAFNRLIPPEDWEVHEGKLVFMVENQRVVVWGVNPDAEDSKVFQSAVIKRQLKNWYEESTACSRFLIFTLHLQSAYGGGMAHCASTAVPQEFSSQLDSKFQFVDEIGGMRAYSGPGQAICLTQFPKFPKGTEWRVFAGATERTALETLASELRIAWDINRSGGAHA